MMLTSIDPELEDWWETLLKENNSLNNSLIFCNFAGLLSFWFKNLTFRNCAQLSLSIWDSQSRPQFSLWWAIPRYRTSSNPCTPSRARRLTLFAGQACYGKPGQHGIRKLCPSLRWSVLFQGLVWTFFWSPWCCRRDCTVGWILQLCLAEFGVLSCCGWWWYHDIGEFDEQLTI